MVFKNDVGNGGDECAPANDYFNLFEDGLCGRCREITFEEFDVCSEAEATWLRCALFHLNRARYHAFAHSPPRGHLVVEHRWAPADGETGCPWRCVAVRLDVESGRKDGWCPPVRSEICNKGWPWVLLVEETYARFHWTFAVYGLSAETARE